MDNGCRRETQIDSRDAQLRKIFQKMNNQDKRSELESAIKGKNVVPYDEFFRLFMLQRQSYPKFELSHEELFYFRSLADAEKYMRSHTDKVYCNWVVQIPYGDKGVDRYSNWGRQASQEVGRISFRLQ